MKVCLIAPGWIATKADVDSMFTRCGVPFPIGLGYLVSYAEKHGFGNIRVIDLLVSGWHTHTEIDSQRVYIGLPMEKFHTLLDEVKPDVVGISCTFTSQAEALGLIAGEVKKNDPNTMVIAGGAHPSSSPMDCLKDNNIDLVVRGEGEIPFLRLLEQGFEGDFSRIKGLYYKDGPEFRFSGKGEQAGNLDEIPYPPYSAMGAERYAEAGKKGYGQRGSHTSTFSIITSRGCPYQCVFCSIHNISGTKWRKRSPANVLGEIDILVEKYGAQHFLFEDDNLTMDMGRAGEIFDGMARKHPGITWSAPNGIRADRMTEQLAKKMKDSGCSRVSLGIESGDQDFLNTVINKKLDLKEVEKSTGILNKAGITVIGFFILGIPGETADSIKTSINFAKMLAKKGLVPHFFIVTPLPGTELYKISKRDKLLVKENPGPMDYFLATYQSPLLKPSGMSIEELLSWRKKALLSTMFILAMRRPLVFIKYISGNDSLRPMDVLDGLKKKAHMALRYLWDK